MVDKTLEAFGLSVEEMKEANRQAAEQMLPVPYDIPEEVGPTEEKRFGDTAAWAAKDSWEEAKSRFQARGTQEGVAGAIPEADSSVLNTFAAGLGYAADMGLSGLAASDAAWRYSVGLASELIPGMDKNQEQRFTRDVSSIPEAFAGNPTALVNPRLPNRQAMPESTAPRFNTHLYEGAEDFGPVSLKEGQALKAELDYMIEPEVVLTPELGYKRLLEDSRDNLLAYPEGTEPFERAQKRKELLEGLGLERLKALAEQIPHWKSPEYGIFVEETLKPLSESLGVFHLNLLEAVNDMASFLPQKRDPLRESVAEAELPYAAPIGPRASPNSSARLSDLKAEDLGFFDTVYHTSSSPKEFNSFDLGIASGQVRELQDLLGVHVGTPRAAAEKNLDLTEGGKNPQGFTMELRARTDKPLTTEEASRLFNFEPPDMDNPKLQEGFTEQGLKELVYKYEELLFPNTEVQLPEDSLEQAAVALRKDLANQGYTHIPYINDVEDPGSTSLIMLIDRPEDSPAVLRDVRAEFNPEKITDPDLRFAEGGMVLEDQMNTMMAEGGIKDSGMNRDPISGNEIPAGSLAKEVRDDVDAKLSEGEYVVPADVVRFFGVNYFEKLRQKAKSGLEEMDRDGRIGGDPVPMDDDFPFSDEELMSIEDEPIEMAEGGAVSGFNPAAFQPGFSSGTFDGSNQALPSETKTYINPEGEVRSVFFINGQPIQQIPAGFVEDTPENRAKFAESQPTVTPTSESSRDRDRDRGVQVPQSGGGKERRSGYSLDEEQLASLDQDPAAFGQAALKGNIFTGKNLGTLGMAINPALGLLGVAAGTYNEMRNIAGARSALEVMKSRELTDTPEYRQLASDLKARESNLGVAAKGLDSIMDFSGETGAAPLITPAPAPMTPQAIPTGPAPAGSTRSTRSDGVTYDTTKSTGSDGRVTETSRIAPGTSAAPTTSVSPVARPDRPSTPAPSTSRSASEARAEAQRAADRGGRQLATKGRAKGGLVERPKKKPVAKK